MRCIRSPAVVFGGLPSYAKAAHVSGAVVTMVKFDRQGVPLDTLIAYGPELLKEAALESVTHLRVNAYSGVRECPLAIHFQLGHCDKLLRQSGLLHQTACALEPSILAEFGGTVPFTPPR